MPAAEKRPRRLVVHLGDDPVAELLDRKHSGVTVRYLPEAVRAHHGLTGLLSCSHVAWVGALSDPILPDALTAWFGAPTGIR